MLRSRISETHTAKAKTNMRAPSLPSSPLLVIPRKRISYSAYIRIRIWHIRPIFGSEYRANMPYSDPNVGRI